MREIQSFARRDGVRTSYDGGRSRVVSASERNDVVCKAD
jgi:hypothetical protein